MPDSDEFMLATVAYQDQDQKKDHTSTIKFIEEAQGALIIFDLTNKESYLSIEESLFKAKQINPSIRLLIVGNKVDLCGQADSNLPAINLQNEAEFNQTGLLSTKQNEGEDLYDVPEKKSGKAKKMDAFLDETISTNFN